MNRIERYILFFAMMLSVVASSAQNYTVECEDTCTHIHGIDISHYQGEVFWEHVGDTKMAYCYIKATEGGDRIDARYEQNLKIGHSYGVKVGSYHFYRPRTEQEKQLNNFIVQCRPSEQDLIPMIDVETAGGLPTEEFCDSLFKFIEMVEHVYRQRPLIYTGTNFYNKHLAGKIDDYPLFIAKYTEPEPVLSDGRDYILWQYTGKGRLNGFNTYVDKSRIMGRHRLREIRFKHW
jgi:lysozyme